MNEILHISVVKSSPREPICGSDAGEGSCDIAWILEHGTDLSNTARKHVWCPACINHKDMDLYLINAVEL